MDNFLTWVDAPSEALIPTPIEDESNNYLRDEILQIQQFVVDKLDEQKINDTEEEDRSMDDSMLAQRVVDDMRVEKRRSDAIQKAMAGFQRDCAKNELHLVSLKQKFPVSDITANSFDKLIDEMNHEVSRLQDQLASRELELQKRQQSTPKNQKEEEKKKVLKLRESYLETKRKDEKLRALQIAFLKLQNEYDTTVQRQKQEKQDFEKACATLKADEERLEQLNDDNASMRAKLVELESMRSTSSTGSDEKYIARLKSETERIRRETADSRSKLESLNSQIAEMRLSSKETTKSNKKAAKEVEEKRRALVALLRKKFDEARKAAMKEDVRRKILELKAALVAETAEFEKNKKKLAEMLPGKNKTVAELKKEIASIEATTRSRDKKIKEAIRQNEKLLEQIAKMDVPKVPSHDSFNLLDQTADIVVVSEKKSDVTLDIPTRRSSRDTWKSAPRLPLDVTPIHAPPPRNREISVDVITGIPPVKEWMTSTPLHKTRRQKSTEKAERPQKQEKTAPKNSRQTRGSTRRSAENAAAAIAAAASAKPEPTQKRRRKN